MRKELILLGFSIFCFTIVGCGQNRGSLQFNSDYIDCRNEFDKSLTNHFPEMLEAADYHRLSCKTDSKKNNVGILLYEYGVDIKHLEAKVTKLKKNSVAIYSSSDSCLLIVNRFETMETLNNNTNPKILDSTTIDVNCFKSKYPVPNFVEYNRNEVTTGSFNLDSGFELYVLEAKPGFNFSYKDLKPNHQMPVFWKNGMSKGVAINAEKRVVIYWGIVW